VTLSAGYKTCVNEFREVRHALLCGRKQLGYIRDGVCRAEQVDVWFYTEIVKIPYKTANCVYQSTKIEKKLLPLRP